MHIYNNDYRNNCQILEKGNITRKKMRHKYKKNSKFKLETVRRKQNQNYITN